MSFENASLNIGLLDTLSYQDTYVHRIDPRIKIAASFLFILCVVSFPKYEIAGLLPFFVYPAFLVAAGNIPAGPVLKRVLLLSPFVVLVGIFNPLFDRAVAASVWGVEISGGWISFLSIVLKFTLTTGTAFLLIATTSFSGLCEGLQRLKVPDAFVVQLLFLYRYLFVLMEEAFRMARARNARSFGIRGYEIRTGISLLSVLLVRTLQKAERIYGAMTSRGFSGRIAVRKTVTMRASDLFFLAVAAAVFIFLRYYNLSAGLGRLIGGMPE